MGDNDVEMEVAQKNAHDSGNNVEESEGKVFNDRFENKGEELPSAVTVAENVLKCENDGEDINKLNSEAEERIPFEREIDNQTYHETETDKAMYVDCSTAEKINNINESEQRNNRAIISEDLSVPRSTSDEPTDSKNYKVEHGAANGGLKEEHGVVEQKVANGGLTKEKSTNNGRETGEPAQNSEGNEDGAKEKTMGTVKEEADFVNHVASKAASNEKSDRGSDNSENGKSQTELSSYEAPQAVQNVALDEIPQSVDKEMEDASIVNENKAVNNEEQQNVESLLASPVTDGKIKTVEAAIKHESDDSCLPKQPDAVTPNSVVIYSPANDGDHGGQTVKTVYSQAALPPMGESDDGTPEDQAAFMSELESFYREKAMEFKPPKFYGQPLNCLKLWRAVIRLGGCDRVTGSKLWRQVGESFNPPKTCTTVSWTFRIFYEKALLEFERHKRQMGDLQLPVATFPEASGADSEGNGCQGSGSGRARRDAAARAMQGWHVQRLSGNGEVGEPVIKDKSINNAAKREKNMKSIGSLKQKRPNEVEHTVKVARTETSKQLASSVVDIGPPADWVKINVRQTKDCFEVYALVPGLLREEVRVQSDPAGRLVITGQPEQADNPWGITPFKKQVVSLPARIDPLQTSAVVSLHGRLFVRVPFEMSNA